MEEIKSSLLKGSKKQKPPEAEAKSRGGEAEKETEARKTEQNRGHKETQKQ